MFWSQVVYNDYDYDNGPTVFLWIGFIIRIEFGSAQIYGCLAPKSMFWSQLVYNDYAYDNGPKVFLWIGFITLIEFGSA